MDAVAEDLRRVHEEVARDFDALVNRVLALAPQLPGYDGVPRDLLEMQVRASLGVVVEAVLVHQVTPGDEHRAWLSSYLDQRAASGVPIEDFLRGIVLVQRELWTTVVGVAGRVDAGAEALARFSSLIMAWLSAISMEAVNAYRRIEETAARADEHRRNAILRGLLRGELPAATITADLIAFGLPAAGDYLVACARSLGEGSVTLEAERQFARHVATNGGIAGVLDGEAVAVLPAGRPLEAHGAAIGVGPAGPLSHLPESFRIAARVAAAAARFGRKGVFSAEDLGARLAIASDEFTGNLLAERYVAPVRALGTFGKELAESVRSYLNHGLRIDPSAAALHVHPNTMRYRLKRFEEVTGADLGRIDDIVGIWWALESAR